MPPSAQVVGSVVCLWRYPVKSMMGEELNAAEITERGLVGDRVYAVIDPTNNKVASVKNPSKWGKLFGCRAAFLAPPQRDQKSPPVRITLPEGTVVSSEQPDLDQILSRVLGRAGTFAASAPPAPSLEEYWPDLVGLAHRETVTDEAMPAGTFFDCAVIHLLTTSTIDRLRELYPQGRFEVRRFRPNIVVEVTSGSTGFVENDWIGRTLAIGNDVRIKVAGPCPRCVMTTWPQSDLPKDYGILRTAAKHNQANVGIYAAVVTGGTIRCGDALTLG